jgi:fucose permease
MRRVVHEGQMRFSWKWLYVVAAAICLLLLIAAARSKYPEVRHSSEEPDRHADH